MKSYREIADSVLARRDQYVIAQRRKKQAVTRVTASVGSVALVSLAGIALFKNDAFHETPPVATPTTTHSPATEGTLPTTTAADSTTVTTAATTPTASATAPSKTEPTVSTSPSTTGKTQPTETVTQTQPTASQTQTTVTQTQPTQTTATTQPTVPPQTDDYIVVETTVSAGEPSPIYMLRASIPTQYNIGTMDEYIPISLSYGCVENTPVEGPPDVVLYFLDEDGEEYIFKRIERQRFLVEYAIRRVWDENRVWVTDYIYSRTETICLPLSLFSDISGRVWIALADGTSEEKDEIVENGYLYSVASVCFDYVCSGTSIGFSVIDE